MRNKSCKIYKWVAAPAGGGGGGGGGAKSNPLPFHIPFWQKRYPFYMPFIQKRGPLSYFRKSCSSFHVVLNK